MKKLKLLLLVLAFLLLPVGAYAASEVYELGVDGLACPYCAYGIEKQVSYIDGVETIEVNIKMGQVIVTMVEGAVLSEERARQATADAGFTLRSFAQSDGRKTD